MTTIAEELYNEKREASERCREAFNALLKIDDYSTQLNAVLECELDFLFGMNLEGIDGAYHEKMLALTEIALNIVGEIRKTMKDSPVA